MAGLDTQLAEIVRQYDPLIVARGRRYALEGKVTGIRREENAVHAFVHGTERYEVSIDASHGWPDADCTCLAFMREQACKHVAAVSIAVSQPVRADREDLPEVLQSVYSSAAFFARLPMYAAEPLAISLEQWLPLYEWWRRPGGELLRKKILELAPAIEKDLQTLRDWEPPPTPLPGTVFGELYDALATIYREWKIKAKVRRCAPGPIGRHPGFVLTWEPKRRSFEAREGSHPLLTEPHRLGFTLPHVGRGQPRLEDSRGYGDTDAWELFALRAVLTELVLQEDPAVERMVDQLGRPMWDALLEKLAPKITTPHPREWGFGLTERYNGRDLVLRVFSRKNEKWKADKFDALYADDNANIDEKDIARIALCSADRAGEAKITLGTPQAHELLKALAKHDRVHYALSGKLDSDVDPKAQIVVGPLTMKLEAGANGALSPRFFAGDRDLSGVILEGTGALRGGSRGAMIASAVVPLALKPWLDAAAAGTVAFPPEAIPRLLEATQSLVASGHIVFPRNALGAEVEAKYAAGLRIEWRPEGGAVVHVFAQVHPKAPLVLPGAGPELFTFEVDGQRVFAERDLEEEKRVASKVRAHVPVVWDEAVGRADGIAEAVQLAEWLDRNPLGLSIEVTIGRTPSVVAWEAVTRHVSVRREGSWLVLDGGLDVKGAKLTLGDVLEAARLARRFVKARDGLFIELSKEAIDRLKPLAVASELAPPGKLHPAFGALIGDALDDRELRARFEQRVERVRVPSIEGTLRPYQKEGASWMLRLASWAPGCVLADDMGLGKTVQTAAVLKARAELGPQLIVAPASVTSNWMSELARFVPKLRVRWFNEERELGKVAANDIVVVSYGLLGKLPAAHWSTVVVDEAQYVKNAFAMRTDAVRSLDRDFTIALTGTPLENHAGELFSIVDLVFPGLLGTEHTFRERFRKPIEGTRDSTRLAILGRLLGPFLLRRTRKEVLDELPPREEITEWIELSKPEQKKYLALRKACEQQFAKRKKGETSAQMKIALLAALTRLRQLACDPALVDPTWTEESTKTTRAVEIVTALAQEKNRALVFSQFTTFLTKLKSAFERAGLRVAYLSGETPTAKRKAIVDAFQAGEYDVFCVSLLAGGTGLNLTGASYVIHTDPWWNPAAEEQATSRAHRMGQLLPVTVYRMVSRGTIEEAVIEMHAKKKELAAAVLEGKDETSAITSDELLALLQR